MSKFCTKCGASIKNDEATVCLTCGCAVSSKGINTVEEFDSLAIFSMVSSFLFPFINLIISSLAMYTFKDTNKKSYDLSKLSMIISIVVDLLYVLGAISLILFVIYLINY